MKQCKSYSNESLNSRLGSGTQERQLLQRYYCLLHTGLLFALPTQNVLNSGVRQRAISERLLHYVLLWVCWNFLWTVNSPLRVHWRSCLFHWPKRKETIILPKITRVLSPGMYYVRLRVIINFLVYILTLLTFLKTEIYLI